MLWAAAENMAPGGVLAPSPAPGRNGSLAWRAVANPGQLQMVTFELEVIGQDAQVRPPLPGGSGPPPWCPQCRSQRFPLQESGVAGGPS